MGTHCSSELRRGHRNITMKLLLLTVFAAVALAEEVAEVEEVAKSAVVPLGYYPYAYNQLHWPAVYGIGFSSQCWGCRGKRSADPAPGVSPPFPGNIKMENIDYGKTQIKYLSKRSAEAEPYYGFLPYGYGLPFYYGVPALTLPELKDLPREPMEDVSVRQKLIPDFWGTGTTPMPTTLMLCMWYPWSQPLRVTESLPTLKPVPLL